MARHSSRHHRRVLADIGAVLKRAWPEIGALLLLQAVALVVTAAVAVSILEALLRSRYDSVVAAGEQPGQADVLPYLLGVMVPAGLFVLWLTAVAVAAIAKASDDALNEHPRDVFGAVRRGVRRAHVLLGGLLVALGVAALLLVLTPALMVVGLVGLALAPAIVLLRRRGRDISWPAVRRLVVLAVPLAPAVVVLVSWGLLVPAAVLEGGGVRTSLRRSRLTTREGWGTAAAFLVGAAALAMATSLLLDVIETYSATALTLILRIVAQFVIVALPIAVAVVLFSRLAPTAPQDLRLNDGPRRSGPGPALAGALMLALALPALVTQLPVAPAFAAAPQQSFTVNDFEDTPASNPDDVTAGDGECKTVDNTCTLRAAVQEANASAPTQTVIIFSSGGTIYLNAALEISAPVGIDGTGNKVAISGEQCDGCGSAHRIFDFTTAAAYTLKNLSLVDGLGSRGGKGGGAVASIGAGTIDTVFFARNRSGEQPGGAVTATGGSMRIVNSTFEDNGSAGASAGDVYSEIATDIDFSTLSAAKGGSLETGGSGSINVQSSVVASSSAPLCSGDIFLPNSRTSSGSSCESQRLQAALPSAADNGGWVLTIATDTSHGTVDQGNSSSFPPFDARGVSRPQAAGPDSGAYEYVAPTIAATVVIGSNPSPSARGGQVTITASVSNADGTTLGTGTVVFKDAGTSIGEAPLVDGVATLTTNTLTLGDHTLSAEYAGDVNLTSGSDSTPHTVNKSTTSSDLSANPSAGVAGQVSTFTATVSATEAGTTTTGTVTFTDGGSLLGEETLVNGVATLSTSTLATGSHDITAEYSGDTDHATSSADLTFQVFAESTAVEVTADPVSSANGDDVTFTTSVSAPGNSATPTGTVTFREGGTDLAEVDLVNGVAKFTTDTLDTGVHTITAAYSGDANFGPGQNSVDHRVFDNGSRVSVTITPEPSMFGEDVTISAEVSTPGIDATATGDVTFRDGTDLLATAALVDGGAIITTTALDAGPHTIRATYSGDGNHPGGSGTVDHRVLATTSLTLNPPTGPTVKGEAAAFRIFATSNGGPTPTGDVVLETEFGGFIGSATLDGSGSADIVVSDLRVDTQAFRATYAGDRASSEATSATVDHTVQKAPTFVEMTSSANPAKAGDPLTLRAQVSVPAPGAVRPTGNVVFSDDGTLIAQVPLNFDGSATLTTTDLPVGSRPITAIYLGDGNLEGSSDSLTQRVERNETRATLRASPSTVAVGDEVTLTARVSGPGSTGLVEFFDGATSLGTVQPDGSGRAELVTNSLDVGDHQLTATYLRNETYETSSATITLTVLRRSTPLTLTASPRTPVTGEPVTLTATVDNTGPGTPTGEVTFSFQGLNRVVTLDPATGTASVTLPAPVTSNRFPTRARATYSGDDRFAGSNAFTNLFVERAVVAVDLQISPTETEIGDEVIAEVTVTPLAPSTGDVSGTVELRAENRGLVIREDLVNNRHIFGLGADEMSQISLYEFTAHYLPREPDRGWKPGTSDPVRVRVDQATTTTRLSVSPSPSAAGQRTRLTASVSTDAPLALTGGVEFLNGPDRLGTASLQSDGRGGRQAVLDVSELDVGTYSLTARYGGTQQLATSRSGAVTHLVETLSTGVITGATNASFGDPTTFFARVQVTDTRVLPRPTPTGRISLYVNGVLYRNLTPASIGNGGTLAEFTTTLPDTGTYRIRAVYDPTGGNPFANPIFAAGEATSTVTVGAARAQVQLLTDARERKIAWGRRILVGARVTSADLPAASRISGDIVISDGQGTSCTVQAPADSCYLSWANPGSKRLTAKYLGNKQLSSATSDLTLIEVTKRSLEVQASADPKQPFTGDPITVSWELRNGGVVPPRLDGRVNTTVAGKVCRSEATGSGSCANRLDLSAAGKPQELRVDYLGSALYEAASWVSDITPRGCYPLALTLIASPGGSMTASPAPDCNGGLGYRKGSTVTLTVDPPAEAPGKATRVTWSDGAPPGLAASYRVGPDQAEGQVLTVTATVSEFDLCAQITIREADLRGPAAGRVVPNVEPNCTFDAAGGAIAPTALTTDRFGEQRGRYTVGTTIRMLPELEDDSVVYGYARGAPEFEVTDDLFVQAVIGPRCYAVNLTTYGDGAGQVAIPEPTCRNEYDGTEGYRLNTELDVVATLADGSYATNWSGTDTTPEGAADRYYDEAARRRIARETNALTVTDPAGHDVQVELVACRRLTIRPIYAQYVDDETNTASVSPQGNCPTSDAEALYERDAVVALTAKTNRWTDLARWNVPERFQRGLGYDWDEETRVRMVDDLVAKPAFGNYNTCARVTVRFDKTQPDGTVAAPGLTDDEFCRLNSLTDGPGRELAGLVGVPDGQRQMQLEAQVENDPLVVWTIDSGMRKPEIPLTGRSVQTTIKRGHRYTITATACQAVRAKTKLITPTGEEIVAPAAPDFVLGAGYQEDGCGAPELSWKVGSQVQLLPGMSNDPGYEFLRWEGDVSGKKRSQPITLDDSKPYLDVTAVYAPVCVALTSPNWIDLENLIEPDCPGGPEPVAAPTMNEIMGANAMPFGKSLTKTEKLDVQARMSAAPYLGSYLNGSVSAVNGTLPEDRVFKGWSKNALKTDPDYKGIRLVPMRDGEDTGFTTTKPPALDALDKVNGTTTTLSGAVEVEFRHRDTNAGEDFVDFWANTVPIIGKKVLGVVALAAKQIILDYTILTVAGLAFSAVGLLGQVVDLKDFGTYMKYAEETVALLGIGFDCTARWAMAGSPDGGNKKIIIVDPNTPGKGEQYMQGVVDNFEAQQAADQKFRLENDGAAENSFATKTGVEIDGADDGSRGVPKSSTYTKVKNKVNGKLFGTEPANPPATPRVTSKNIKTAKLKLSGAKKVAKGGAVAGVAFDAYSTVSSAGWDESGHSAWTDSTAAKECFRDMMPGYVPDPETW